MQKFWLGVSQIIAAAVLLFAGYYGLTLLLPQLLPAPGDSVVVKQVAPGSGSSLPVSSVNDAARKAIPSVVNIYSSKQARVSRHPLLQDPFFRRFFGDRFENETRRVSNLGSGVVVSTSGYILTNHHVVETADEVRVALSDGRTFEARLVGTDPESDLAVLKVNAGNLPAITFSAPDSARVGDVVLAIGNPFGVGQTVTMGIVSALNRSHLGINTFENFIQTDAAINPGNSGGALVDSAGNLIGINTAIYSRTGGSMGIGFAIPTSTAKQVMEQIIKHGSVTRGWVGIEVQDITPELAESFGLKSTDGALISGVLRGGPADRGGIKAGDILLEVEGGKVTDSSSLLNLIAALPPGGTAKLRIQRANAQQVVAVQVGKRPVMQTAEEEAE
jgi:serine protease DegQ